MTGTRRDAGFENMTASSAMPLSRTRGLPAESGGGCPTTARGITEAEPPLFNEPALFLLRPDGTVYYVSLLSMPVGRPRLDELLGGIDYWAAHGYPARSEA